MSVLSFSFARVSSTIWTCAPCVGFKLNVCLCVVYNLDVPCVGFKFFVCSCVEYNLDLPCVGFKFIVCSCVEYNLNMRAVCRLQA